MLVSLLDAKQAMSGITPIPSNLTKNVLLHHMANLACSTAYAFAYQHFMDGSQALQFRQCSNHPNYLQYHPTYNNTPGMPRMPRRPGMLGYCSDGDHRL